MDPKPTYNITSDQINFLIYQYLQESGFTHSAYTFQNESHILSSCQNEDVPPGALINYLQKALQYVEVETHLTSDGSPKECTAPFSLIGQHFCEKITEKVSRKHKRDDTTTVSNRKERERKDERRNQKDQYDREKRFKDEDFTQDRQSVNNGDDMDVDRVPLAEIPATVARGNGKPPSESNGREIDDFIVLKGHQGEVFVCGWNSKHNDILASGGGDATTRIWKVPSSKSAESEDPIVLTYEGDKSTEKNVTTLDWNSAGSLLAVGYSNGNARIWTEKGELKCESKLHTAAILGLRWNKMGTSILSSSMDGGVVLWDPKNNSKQVFDSHSDVVLDCEWVDDKIFATCSKDKLIFVCSIDKKQPLQTFAGHENEVNTIKYDPVMQLFASGSDDCTVKIWKMDKKQPIHTFNHDQGIFSLRWHPVPVKAHDSRILATSSFDSAVRLWDVKKGTCLFKFPNNDTIHSISFSPDGKYIATGCFDECIKVWNVKTGNLRKEVRSGGAVFEVSFKMIDNKYRLAASLSNGTVVVIDLR